jgi:ferric-dicitrate binding protein FerR (iron transport regulator)
MVHHEEEALWALAAGELEPEARLRVEMHVANCPTCARRLAGVKETRALLRETRSSTPQVRWTRVDERVLGEATRHFARLERRPRWTWMLATVGACAAVVLALLPHPGGMPLAPEPAAVAQREEAPLPTPVPTPPIEVEGEADAWVLEVDGAGHALRSGAGLRAGAAVRTPSGGSARLRLPDASRMQVAADSEVELSRVEQEEVHLRVVRGRIAVRASHAERRGFTVEAASLRAVVVGTVFSVEHTPSGAAVSVLEGKVRVESEGQSPQLVTAGQRVEFRTRERSWRRHSLSARDRRAFEALVPQAAEVIQVKASRPPRSAPAPVAPPPVTVAPEPDSPSSMPEPPLAVAPPVEAWPELEPAPLPPALALPEVKSPPEPAIPWQGAPAPREVEERFLRHARADLNHRMCESYLVGLGEIAEQSRVRALREEARYLRARCHELRFSPNEAATEYRLYLREYPHGRWAREARVALLP